MGPRALCGSGNSVNFGEYSLAGMGFDLGSVQVDPINGVTTPMLRLQIFIQPNEIHSVLVKYDGWSDALIKLFGICAFFLVIHPVMRKWIHSVRTIINNRKYDGGKPYSNLSLIDRFIVGVGRIRGTWIGFQLGLIFAIITGLTSVFYNFLLHYSFAPAVPGEYESLLDIIVRWSVLLFAIGVDVIVFIVCIFIGLIYLGSNGELAHARLSPDIQMQ